MICYGTWSIYIRKPLDKESEKNRSLYGKQLTYRVKIYTIFSIVYLFIRLISAILFYVFDISLLRVIEKMNQM